MEIGEPVAVPAIPASGEAPAEPEVVLVELVEAVTHGGAETLQQPLGRRQYVNLDPTRDPAVAHPEFGPVLRFKARAAALGAGGSVANRAVYWSYTMVGRGVGASGPGFGAPGGPATHTATCGGDGWTDVVELHLSSYGGDEFRVSASLTETSGGDERTSGTYTVWRRLFFAVTEMKTPVAAVHVVQAGDTLSRIATRYGLTDWHAIYDDPRNAAFKTSRPDPNLINPGDVVNIPTSPDDRGKYDMPAALLQRVTAGFENVFIELRDTGARSLGDYEANFDEVEKAFVWADRYCTAGEVPLKLHICVVDHTVPLAGPYGATAELVEEDADASPYTSTGTIRPYDFSGHPWLTQAEYWDGASWQLLAARVSLVGARGSRPFEVDFTGTGLNPTPASPVKVRLSYLCAGLYGGWGGESSLHLVLCRGEYEDMLARSQADDQLVVACLHEPGHAMGLVDASAAWHDAAHDGHCVHVDCTMWFESSPGNERFHPETVGDPGCRTALREKTLDEAAMRGSWKFPR